MDIIIIISTSNETMSEEEKFTTNEKKCPIFETEKLEDTCIDVSKPCKYAKLTADDYKEFEIQHQENSLIMKIWKVLSSLGESSFELYSQLRKNEDSNNIVNIEELVNKFFSIERIQDQISSSKNLFVIGEDYYVSVRPKLSNFLCPDNMTDKKKMNTHDQSNETNYDQQKSFEQNGFPDGLPENLKEKWVNKQIQKADFKKAGLSDSKATQMMGKFKEYIENSRKQKTKVDSKPSFTSEEVEEYGHFVDCTIMFGNDLSKTEKFKYENSFNRVKKEFNLAFQYFDLNASKLPNITQQFSSEYIEARGFVLLYFGSFLNKNVDTHLRGNNLKLAFGMISAMKAFYNSCTRDGKLFEGKSVVNPAEKCKISSTLLNDIKKWIDLLVKKYDYNGDRVCEIAPHLIVVPDYLEYIPNQSISPREFQISVMKYLAINYDEGFNLGICPTIGVGKTSLLIALATFIMLYNTAFDERDAIIYMCDTRPVRIAVCEMLYNLVIPFTTVIIDKNTGLVVTKNHNNCKATKNREAKEPIVYIADSSSALEYFTNMIEKNPLDKKRFTTIIDEPNIGADIRNCATVRNNTHVWGSKSTKRFIKISGTLPYDSDLPNMSETYQKRHRGLQSDIISLLIENIKLMNEEYNADTYETVVSSLGDIFETMDNYMSDIIDKTKLPKINSLPENFENCGSEILIEFCEQIITEIKNQTNVASERVSSDEIQIPINLMRENKQIIAPYQKCENKDSLLKVIDRMNNDPMLMRTCTSEVLRTLILSMKNNEVDMTNVPDISVIFSNPENLNSKNIKRICIDILKYLSEQSNNVIKKVCSVEISSIVNTDKDNQEQQDNDDDIFEKEKGPSKREPIDYHKLGTSQAFELRGQALIGCGDPIEFLRKHFGELYNDIINSKVGEDLHDFRSIKNEYDKFMKSGQLTKKAVNREEKRTKNEMERSKAIQSLEENKGQFAFPESCVVNSIEHYRKYVGKKGRPKFIRSPIPADQIPVHEMTTPEWIITLMFAGIVLYDERSDLLCSKYREVVSKFAQESRWAMVIANDTISFGTNWPFTDVRIHPSFYRVNAIVHDKSIVKVTRSIFVIFQMLARAGRWGKSWIATGIVPDEIADLIIRYSQGLPMEVNESEIMETTFLNMLREDEKRIRDKYELDCAKLREQRERHTSKITIVSNGVKLDARRVLLRDIIDVDSDSDDDRENIITKSSPPKIDKAIEPEKQSEQKNKGTEFSWRRGTKIEDKEEDKEDKKSAFGTSKFQRFSNDRYDGRKSTFGNSKFQKNMEESTNNLTNKDRNSKFGDKKNNNVTQTGWRRQKET